MDRAWLLKRLFRLAVLVAIPATVIVALAHAWPRVAALLNGSWPPLRGRNVANVVQIATPVALLALWLTSTTARVSQVR